MTKHILTQEELKNRFNYDPDTGIFTRKITTGPRWKSGSIAGTDNGNGYIKININGRIEYAHRLAWIYVYGSINNLTIDHINGIRSDNRIKNLRLISKSENNQNMDIQKSNKSGYKGVSWDKSKNKWVAQISINNKHCLIGRYSTKEDAFNAYLEAKERHHVYANLSRLVG